MECSFGRTACPGDLQHRVCRTVEVESCFSSSSASRNFASRSASTSTAFPALRSKDVRAMPAGKKVLHMRGRAQHILIKCRKKPHRSGWLRRPKFVKICGQYPGFRPCKADFGNTRSQRSQYRIHMRERCPSPSRIVYPCRRTIRRKEPAGQVDPSPAGVRSERSVQPHVGSREAHVYADTGRETELPMKRRRFQHPTPTLSQNVPKLRGSCDLHDPVG